MTPAVSIITPAYQAEPFIARAVKSVLAQTHADWEMIIIADDAQDYEKLLAGQGLRDSRLRYVTTGGIGTKAANARNAALDNARGDFIMTLDADDLLAPTALATLAPHAARHGAAYGNIRFLEFESGVALPNYNRPMQEGVLSLEEVLTSNFHTYAGLMFDRRKCPALR